MHDREILSALEEPHEWLRIGASFGPGGRVVSFVVQYETWVAERGEFLAVARFDTAHGHPHLDRLDRAGNVVSKEQIGLISRDEALQYAEHYLRRFWRVFKDEF